MGSSNSPKIIEKRELKLSKWLTIVERDIIFPGGADKETYYSVRPYDYVSVLAVTKDQRIPLVRQYRPVLERESLELPGGLLDMGQNPEETVLIELKQETGLIAPCAQSLGILSPDPGRLDNRFHRFFAPDAVVDPSLDVEEGIELVWTDFDELREMVLDGRFDSSLQIALLALATLKGCIKGRKI